ncbi:MAG: glycosyltransferase family 47 protein [Bacteroidia bacterium]|nr:glycosyltransferase family 47 protein [Bacteroidia bacterium]NNF32452.1 hypothetical protein [Flavobacteriaceae bacterium]MBT8267890.1 glycosyltransferase family 47 protein [Bacteroidia bacterium]MBT8276138.1 glycosyltransferase family 47 protein [Bacteroidia bacterium]NNJ81719.1 hypothetical protein [Flavobacteriaceae bacterium]
MIKVYVEPTFRLEAPIYQLFPLLEELEKPDSAVHEAYSLVSDLSNASIAMVPMSVPYLMQKGYKPKLWAFIKKCEQEQKPVLVFTGGDYGLSLPFSNVLTVRLGGMASKLDASTYIMPPFISDPYDILKKEPTYLDHTTVPTVGFVGHSNGSLAKLLKEYASFWKGRLKRFTGNDPTERQSFYPSSYKRYRYLKMLEQKGKVETNFIHRKKYRAGAKETNRREATQLEFYENMESNLYTFCMRGTGNFSVRFYEALAMGRIPLWLDTDCQLPFADRIDWDQHIVRVEEQEAGKLDEKLSAFHQQLTESGCIEIQKKNRLLWQKYFQKDSFFLNLHEDLKSNLHI